MATTCIIAESGDSISVHPNYYTKPRGQNPREHWCFSVNVERYRYKPARDIRYNVEIVGKRIRYNHPDTNIEEFHIFRSHRRPQGIKMVDKASTLLQSLLQAIDNGDPVWDVRELL